MTDGWFEAMDQGLYTGAIFLDLRKALNVVHLDLLVIKLKMYGCTTSALLWLKSYLSDRRQCSNIKGTLSDTGVLRSTSFPGFSPTGLTERERERDPGKRWSRGSRTKLILREESFVSHFFVWFIRNVHAVIVTARQIY